MGALLGLVLLYTPNLAVAAGSRDLPEPMAALVDGYVTGRLSVRQVARLCRISKPMAITGETVPSLQAATFCEAFVNGVTEFGAMLGTPAEDRLVGRRGRVDEAWTCPGAAGGADLRGAILRRQTAGASDQTAAQFAVREVLKCGS